MPLILGTNSIKDTGFNVANSCRFDRGSTDFLNKTLSTPTNVDKATFSTWVKFTDTSSGNDATLFGVLADGNNTTYIQLLGSKVIRLNMRESTNYIGVLTTNRVFRDPSAWYHIVVAFDTTQGTDSNRIKLYVNGVQETSFSTATYPSQNTDLRFNTSGQVFNIGRRGDSVNLLDGYLAETVFIDGQQLAPDQFGEFDEDTGIWKPIDVSGLTFGNNGFYLDYEDSGNLGNDVNGGTDLTVNNLTAIDQSTDTCTNNFATLNPLIKTAYGSELSNGNLDCVQSDVRGRFHNVTTIGASSGKYYAEIKLTGGSNHTLGVATDASFTYASTLLTSGFNYLGQSGTLSYSYYVADGTVYINGTNTAYGATLTTNDILGIYLDLDNHKLYFSKNGALQSSTGIDIPTGYDYFFGVGDLGTGDSGEVSCNFGSPAFAISSGNTDGEYGNFEYSTTITGDGASKTFKALNTKNLAEYG